MPNTMLDRFLTFIHKEALLQQGQKVLLAVSGGIDSVVLLDLFSQTNFPFAIAHCNFSLRGEESEQDEAFVHNLSKYYQVPFYTIKFDTLSFAKTHQISIQMAARELRYGWFQRLCLSHGIDLIATAHHQNDLAETVLLNLSRGTGIAGLHGIQAKKNNLIRPLLCFDKDDIQQYAEQNQIQWREDSSNQSVKYSRNLIRQEIIPVLKKINPNLENTFSQNIEKIGAVEALFLLQMEDLRKNIMQTTPYGIEINTDYFKKSPYPEIQLHELLKPYHFGYLQSKNIIKSLENQSGKIFYSPFYRLVKDRNKLIIQELKFIRETDEIVYIKPGETPIRLETFELVFEVMERDKIEKPITVSTIALLDYERLQFPLMLRKWIQKDYFYPLGMKNKKKLSDFFTNSKLSIPDKEQIRLLISGEEVVWIIGHRIDDRYKISDQTRKILKITLEPIQNV